MNTRQGRCLLSCVFDGFTLQNRELTIFLLWLCYCSGFHSYTCCTDFSDTLNTIDQIFHLFKSPFTIYVIQTTSTYMLQGAQFPKSFSQSKLWPEGNHCDFIFFHWESKTGTAPQCSAVKADGKIKEVKHFGSICFFWGRSLLIQPPVMPCRVKRALGCCWCHTERGHCHPVLCHPVPDTLHAASALVLID